ncbi:MAG: carbohydrate ABC transporter permease, partial [Rhodococcus sp. (in: high G+C Gram-positive bacteria)]
MTADTVRDQRTTEVPVTADAARDHRRREALVTALGYAAMVAVLVMVA